MAKKIPFGLSLPDGTRARSMGELREHFELEAVLGHYKSGKLLTWLRDRYFEGEADAVEELDENATDFQKKLCEALGVEFTGNGADLEEIARRQERLDKLRQFTDDDELIQNIDAVAFDQEELAALLDEGCERIYLCGDKFTVPASVQNKVYVGVNSPAVHISGKVGDDWESRNIIFSGCEVENLPTSAQEVTPTAADDEGPVVITDEMAADIFEAIYEDVPEDVFEREIIAETDHYYVIEENSQRYLRFSKVSRTFEELPDLSTFSVASKYWKLGHYSGFLGITYHFMYTEKKPPMLSAPTYQYKDTLYMQEISDRSCPSIWRFDLDTKSLTKLMDGIRFFCPNLPAFMLPCEGRYIPVIKDKKFCVLDLRSLDLLRVRNKGQWMDAPYAAVIAGTKVYFIVNETAVGRTDPDRKAFCSFDLEQNEFSEVQVVVRENGDTDRPLCSHEYWYKKGCRTNVNGLYVQGNKVFAFLSGYYDKSFIIDLSAQPVCADIFDGVPQHFDNIIWGDKIIYKGSPSLTSKESPSLIVTDAVTCKTSETIKLNIDCNDIFARIGNFIYIYGHTDFLLITSFKGGRVSLVPPYDQVPFTLNVRALSSNDVAYEWEPIPKQN